MFAVLFASGLLLQTSYRSDVDNALAQVRATKAAYERCLVERADALYRGSDSPELERAIMNQCRRELSAYEDAVAGGTPEVRASIASSIGPMLPVMAQLAIGAVAACKQNANRLSAADLALCAKGGN